MPLDFPGRPIAQTDEIARLRAENARLRRQNRQLSEDVKQSVKTENKLYQFQAKLDKQVQHYQQLYKLGKVFNQTFDLSTVLSRTAQCLVYDYNFERCLLWMPSELLTPELSMSMPDSAPLLANPSLGTYGVHQPSLKICAFEGYYTEQEVEHLDALQIPINGCLFQELTDQDVLIFNDTEFNDVEQDGQLAQWIRSIGMDECTVIVLRADRLKLPGLLIVGNTATMQQYQNRVTGDPDELLGLANLASQVVAAINNIHVYQALQQQQHLLEKKVTARTQALNAKNKSLETALQSLKQAQAQLIQTEKMSSLGQLVAGVAHEINNPVNFIDGNLQYLQDTVVSLLELLHLYQANTPNPKGAIAQCLNTIDLDFLIDDLPKSMASMHTGVARIQDIVLSLRTFSRMDEAGKKRVDIHDGIESTLMLLEHRLRAQNGHPAIEIIKEYGEIPLVECYAGQLNQVLMNLLVNAIDACEERYTQDRAADGFEQRPNIVICTKFLEDCFIISITDNGVGMSDSVKAQMFNPFFTTKPVGKGTGMGLSIGYQIITERHRGTLTCHSIPGVGTTFTIGIPTDS